ncbi:MAG: hypothetical protein WBA48_19080 [Xanthobacteraceae bacterium]
MTIARAGLRRSGTDLFTPGLYPADDSLHVGLSAALKRQLAKAK